MGLYKTPLRYPGGKQRLWPFFKELIYSNGLVGCQYAEPFAGGAGIAIELLLKGLVSKIHLNDSCKGVYCFWQSILSDPEIFCRRISRASLTVDEWKKQRSVFQSADTADPADLGFALFFLNRCNRSGIVSGGVIGGLNQTGNYKIDARFPRNELIARIETIAARKSAIKVKNLDAERFLTDYASKLPPASLVYCDPPYFRKAERLYPNHYNPEDHSRIAKLMQSKALGNWVVSYDSCVEIDALYAKRRRFTYELQYNAARAYKGSELFVFCDSLKLPADSCLPAISAALSAM